MPDHTQDEEKLAKFTSALTALSVQHGFGITGVLFTMEKEDYERSYRVDDTSGLIFE